MKKRSFNDILRYMLEDMEKAPALFKPTNFWSSGLGKIIYDIENNGIETFRCHKSARYFYVPNFALSFYIKYKKIVKMIFHLISILPKGRKFIQLILPVLDGSDKAYSDYRVFMAADNNDYPIVADLSESQIGNPIEQFCFEGKYYSRSFLNYLRGIVFLKKNVDTKGIRVVLEIGGGYGTLGEILLKSGKSNIFYIDVDIPPVGYVATWYLEELFGKENIANYKITRNLSEININQFSKKYRAMVLCPWQLSLLKGNIDLFVNYISFQEMEPDVVENYVKYIDKLVNKYILLRNSRTGKKVVSKKGDVGVINPISREHYLKYFSNFKPVAINSIIYGDKIPKLESEVIILKRYKK